MRRENLDTHKGTAEALVHSKKPHKNKDIDKPRRETLGKKNQTPTVRCWTSSLQNWGKYISVF
jgi:hypothetical protein